MLVCLSIIGDCLLDLVLHTRSIVQLSSNDVCFQTHGCARRSSFMILLQVGFGSSVFALLFMMMGFPAPYSLRESYIPGVHVALAVVASSTAACAYVLSLAAFIMLQRRTHLSCIITVMLDGRILPSLKRKFCKYSHPCLSVCTTITMTYLDDGGSSLSLVIFVR